jgi:hypothetical protein
MKTREGKNKRINATKERRTYEGRRYARQKVLSTGAMVRTENLPILRYALGATCMLGLWGAVLCQLTERARGVGLRPREDKAAEGRGAILVAPRHLQLAKNCEDGGRRGAVENLCGMDDGGGLVSGRPYATEAFELVPEMGPPPSSSMPWSIQGQRACIRKSGRRWLRVRGPGHTL